MKITSINPSTNEVLSEVEVSTKEEILQKVKAARLALKGWRDLGLVGRVSRLRKVVELIREGKEALAAVITTEMGMPLTQSRMDVDDGCRFFEWYLDHASEYLSPELINEDNQTSLKVFYEPIGVAAVITPWNFPLSNFVWGAAQNLIVGNTVVYKTSKETILFAGKLEEVIIKADLPEGVFSQIFGDGGVGDKLAHQDINLISFTGSSHVGKYLYQVAADKFIKVILEMGGSAPGIVFADVETGQIMEAIYAQRFTNCGQMCDALKRLLVHESKYDEVVGKLKKLVEDKLVGDPKDIKTDIGPLVNKKQLEVLEEQVKDALDKGARVITGGIKLVGEGNFYPPTILVNVTPQMRVWQEEVFGPLLPVVRFSSEDEAISLANGTKYGLGAYIYTSDKERAKRVATQLESGMVSINGANYVQPFNPFGGYKASGMGREHGKFGFHELTRVKVVATPK